MWGIGDCNGPLSQENMNRPLFTPQLQSDMEQWHKELGHVVQHDENALSSIGVTYDCPCGPLKCECTAAAEMARTMLERLM